MGAKRRRIEAGVKAKVALAAMRGDRTTSQLVSQFGVHSTQIGQWKRRLLDGAAELFSDERRREVQNQDALIAELYEQIGRLQMETAWLKKKALPRKTALDRCTSQKYEHRGVFLLWNRDKPL